VANKAVFQSASAGRSVPATDTTNKAGGTAYQFGPKHALAQLACTGTFNPTYYTSPVDQLEGIRQAADQVEPVFLAKCAVYARQKGGMKDMPAALMVMLSKADPRLCDLVFTRVIDNGKMVRNLVQMVRSGVLGRKSMGSGLKRLVNKWIRQRSARALFRATVGKNPSLADVIRLAHPKAVDEEQKALIGYILGREHDAAKLPGIVQHYEAFKRGESAEVPDVDFRQLTSLPLKPHHWAQIVRNGGYQFTIKNLNTAARHSVFDEPGIAELVAARIADREELAKARVFPYQLLVAYLNSGKHPDPIYERYAQYYRRYAMESGAPEPIDLPFEVRDSLQDAMEVATESVPSFGVPTAVIVDVSGSMHSPVTGVRKGSTTKVRCVDVAGLMAATVLRRNKGSIAIPVDTSVHSTRLINPRDTVMTNAIKLGQMGGGGTNLSLALRHLNGLKRAHEFKLVVIVSDNESWVDSRGSLRYGRGTQLMSEFRQLHKKAGGARMVCIDISPNTTTQAPSAPDEILNIGGFSDAIWSTVDRFARGDTHDVDAWVAEIEAISLEQPEA